MIIRIVKMHFREEEVVSFKQLFEERKHLIQAFEGCTHLELWQDKTHPAIFFYLQLVGFGGAFKYLPPLAFF